MSAPAVRIATLIDRLAAAGERYNHMIWLAPGYSLADLLRELRAVLALLNPAADGPEDAA